MTYSIPVKQFTSWSFSRYQVYRQCPLKAKLQFIDKIQAPDEEALRHGREVHEACEKFIKGGSPTPPTTYPPARRLLLKARREAKKLILPAIVEETWALTRDWQMTRWDDWAKCWLRIRLDVAYFYQHQEPGDTLVLIDWKTGKFRPGSEDYEEQGSLYALGAFLLYPDIQEVRVQFVFLDAKHVLYLPVFTQNDVPALKTRWERNVAPMMTDLTFDPRPTNLCQWCFYRKANLPNGGGQCIY